MVCWRTLSDVMSCITHANFVHGDLNLVVIGINQGEGNGI